jgi:hypothetical protein
LIVGAGHFGQIGKGRFTAGPMSSRPSQIKRNPVQSREETAFLAEGVELQVRLHERLLNDILRVEWRTRLANHSVVKTVLVLVDQLSERLSITAAGRLDELAVTCLAEI